MTKKPVAGPQTGLREVHSLAFDCNRGARFAREDRAELRQRAEDMEDELAARRGGVDLFREGFKANAALGRSGDDINQMLERATQAIKASDDERVSSS